MSDKFIVEIITPDQSILKSETNEVTIPSYEGEMGILKDHIPLITFLRPGLIKFKDSKENKFFVEEGTVEFSDNNLLILTSTVKEVSALSKDEIEKKIKDTEVKLKNNKATDKEKYLMSYKIDVLQEISK